MASRSPVAAAREIIDLDFMMASLVASVNRLQVSMQWRRASRPGGGTGLEFAPEQTGSSRPAMRSAPLEA